MTKQSKTTNNNTQKILVDISRPSSFDEFVEMVSFTTLFISQVLT